MSGRGSDYSWTMLRVLISNVGMDGGGLAVASRRD